MIGSRVPGGGSRGGGGRPSNGHNGMPATGMMHNVPPHSTSTGGTGGSAGGMGGGGGTGGRSSLGSSRMGTGRPTNGGVIQGFITNQQQAAREQDLALRQRQHPLASAQGRRAGSLSGMGGAMGAAGGGGGMMPAPPMRQSIGGGGMTQQQVQHAQMRMVQAQQAQHVPDAAAAAAAPPPTATAASIVSSLVQPIPHRRRPTTDARQSHPRYDEYALSVHVRCIVDAGIVLVWWWRWRTGQQAPQGHGQLGPFAGELWAWDGPEHDRAAQRRTAHAEEVLSMECFGTHSKSISFSS